MAVSGRDVEAFSVENIRKTYRFLGLARFRDASALSDALVGRARWDEREVQKDMHLMLKFNTAQQRHFLTVWRNVAISRIHRWMLFKRFKNFQTSLRFDFFY